MREEDSPSLTPELVDDLPEFEDQLPKLGSERHYAFVREYLIDLNASRAAASAGYSEARARTTGWELLQRSDISIHIRWHKRERARKLDLDGDKVLRELSAMAFARMSDIVTIGDDKAISELLTMYENDELFYDEEDFSSAEEFVEHELKRLTTKITMKTSKEMGEAIAAIKEVTILPKGGINFKMSGKEKSLYMLGQHLGLWKHEPANNERDRESNVDRIRRAIQLTRRRAEDRNREGSEGDK